MSPSSYRTIGPVAAELGIPRWRLAYLIERGDLPAPSAQVPGRRLFTDEDVERLRDALSRRSTANRHG
jgi:DNA-binding transcriptional MerR regulator